MANPKEYRVNIVVNIKPQFENPIEKKHLKLAHANGFTKVKAIKEGKLFDITLSAQSSDEVEKIAKEASYNQGEDEKRHNILANKTTEEAKIIYPIVEITSQQAVPNLPQK